MIGDVLTASGVENEPDGSSFHFVLNNNVVKDNRIPPRGFTNDNFISIQSPVIDYSYDDYDYFDNSEYQLPAETQYVKTKLLYQTVSLEYAEFLRDANVTNTAGDDFFALYDANGRSAPVVMVEKEWGTPPAPQLEQLFVQDVTFTRMSAKGSKEYVTAVVTVVDESNLPVSGAVVNASFSGPTSGDVSGTTDDTGMVTFESRSTRNPVGIWCLDINSIDGYDFSPDQWCEPTKSAVLSANPESNFNLTVYPNPFTDKINYEFSSPVDVMGSIEIFDITGRKIETVFEGPVKEGINNRIEFIPQNRVSSIWFYRVVLGEKIYSGKITSK